MLKIGLCCRAFFGGMLQSSRKVVVYFYYVLVIPLLRYLYLFSRGVQSRLIPVYGVSLLGLAIFIWGPTLYARYQRSYWNYFPLYSLLVSVLLVFLSMVFASLNILSLFIFFELSLVPIMAILFKGGKTSKKLEAGLYMFAFTRFSTFLFLAFLVLNNLSHQGVNTFTSNLTRRSYYPLLETPNSGNFATLFIYNLTTIVILVKTPLFFMHIWLPKAHVEAPVFGSMILARLLLKTGGYGYLILSMSLFGLLLQWDYIVSFLILASIMAAVGCSSQVDVKMLIAYSRVNHMRIILCGIILGLRSSTLGRVVLIIGHGVISSALFFLARDRYNQRGSRSFFFSILLGKSNINILYWLILILINAGLPPFLIFMGEVLILKATMNYPYLMFLFFFNYILIGYYSCLILIKLSFSKNPRNVGSLTGRGLAPYISSTVTVIHIFLFLAFTIFQPWLK